MRTEEPHSPLLLPHPHPHTHTHTHKAAEGGESRRSSRTSLAALATSAIDLTHTTDQDHPKTPPIGYEAGRAEALAALCSIFSSQPCREPFLPIYLTRFYHSLAVGLQYDEEVCVCVCVCWQWVLSIRCPPIRESAPILPPWCACCTPPLSHSYLKCGPMLCHIMLYIPVLTTD